MPLETKMPRRNKVTLLRTDTALVALHSGRHHTDKKRYSAVTSGNSWHVICIWFQNFKRVVSCLPKPWDNQRCASDQFRRENFQVTKSFGNQGSKRQHNLSGIKGTSLPRTSDGGHPYSFRLKGDLGSQRAFFTRKLSHYKLATQTIKDATYSVRILTSNEGTANHVHYTVVSRINILYVRQIFQTNFWKNLKL